MLYINVHYVCLDNCNGHPCRDCWIQLFCRAGIARQAGSSCLGCCLFPFSLSRLDCIASVLLCSTRAHPHGPPCLLLTLLRPLPAAHYLAPPPPGIIANPLQQKQDVAHAEHLLFHCNTLFKQSIKSHCTGPLCAQRARHTCSSSSSVSFVPPSSFLQALPGHVLHARLLVFDGNATTSGQGRVCD